MRQRAVSHVTKATSSSSRSVITRVSFTPLAGITSGQSTIMLCLSSRYLHEKEGSYIYSMYNCRVL